MVITRSIGVSRCVTRLVRQINHGEHYLRGRSNPTRGLGGLSQFLTIPSGCPWRDTRRGFQTQTLKPTRGLDSGATGRYTFTRVLLFHFGGWQCLDYPPFYTGKQMDVPKIRLPKRMRGLMRDSRGYPIPFNVMRDADGRPHFTINDDRTRARCLKERRCAVCGYRLERLVWFVGGPRSAFDRYGVYNDTGLHHECATYSLQVCPYLAVPRYLSRIDTGTLDMGKLPPGCPGVFLDHTQIPERPGVFVAVAARSYDVSPVTGYIRPERPYAAVEYWKDGRPITRTEALAFTPPEIELPEE